MLVELSSFEELSSALMELEALPLPDMLYFVCSIRNHLDDKFPESPIRVFAFPEHGPKKYWLMFKDNLYIDAYCMLAHNPNLPYNHAEFLDCLREFRVRALGALNSGRRHLMTGKQQLVKAYGSLMRNIMCDLVSSDLCLNLYYMTEEQKNAVAKVSIDLPSGYSFEDIDAESEATLINDTWVHAGAGDLEQTIAKLQQLPSACVKHRGQPVAFEMCDPAGFYNNLFVMHEHRRRGLGTAVETRLSQICVELDWPPFKTVDKKNKIVIDASEQSAFWTRWEDAAGNAQTMIFQKWVCDPDGADTVDN